MPKKRRFKMDSADSHLTLPLLLETIEWQEEIIRSMSVLLKRYAVELSHIQTITGCLALDNSLGDEMKRLEEDMKYYHIETDL
jgi:hypothetical protein